MTGTLPFQRRTMRAIGVILGTVVLAAGLLVWTAADGGHEAIAFDRVWSFLTCTDVRPVSSERGLLDDAPGAGEGNDAAFAYVKADEVLNEHCTWSSDLAQSTTDFRNLEVRAAVNDGAALRIRAFDGPGCTGNLLGSVLYGAGYHAEADGGFHTVTRTLGLGIVRSICVQLDDRLNGHVQRISALIDRITIRGTSSVAWQESFTKSG